MQAEAIFWLIATLAMLFIEGATAGLVIIWFAIGSLAALICALLGGQIWLQILLFALVSGAALVATRSLVRKYVNARYVRTNADSLIGQTAVVKAAISNQEGTGLCLCNGKTWSARAKDGNSICEGTTVKICAIEGVKLIVVPLDVASKKGV